MDDDNQFTLEDRKRITQQDILPTSIKQRQFSAENISNTALTNGSFTLPGNSRGTITTTLTSAQPNRIIGVAPFMFAFFEGSISDNTEIPSGGGITSTDYSITSFAVPKYPGVTSHNNYNVVYQTTISRVVAGSVTIYWLIQARFISYGTPIRTVTGP